MAFFSWAIAKPDPANTIAAETIANLIVNLLATHLLKLARLRLQQQRGEVGPLRSCDLPVCQRCYVASSEAIYLFRCDS